MSDIIEGEGSHDWYMARARATAARKKAQDEARNAGNLINEASYSAATSSSAPPATPPVIDTALQTVSAHEISPHSPRPVTAYQPRPRKRIAASLETQLVRDARDERNRGERRKLIMAGHEARLATGKITRCASITTEVPVVRSAGPTATNEQEAIAALIPSLPLVHDTVLATLAPLFPITVAPPVREPVDDGILAPQWRPRCYTLEIHYLEVASPAHMRINLHRIDPNVSSDLRLKEWMKTLYHPTGPAPQGFTQTSWFVAYYDGEGKQGNTRWGLVEGYDSYYKMLTKALECDRLRVVIGNVTELKYIHPEKDFWPAFSGKTGASCAVIDTAGGDRSEMGIPTG